jgi:2,3-bisphosphoglycerate-independent phosphoglycerate mutase
MAVKPVVLIIRDGWGHSDRREGNAVLAAATPNTDRFMASCPWTLLEASGPSVGLPEGYQGSSEVGHLNIGAGRIVEQELTRINRDLLSGEVWKSPVWEGLISSWRESHGAFHLLGLLQDEGVHAHIEHLFHILRRARKEVPDGRILVHPFLDGRDTPPRSCLGYIRRLSEVLDEVGGCAIGTVMGRYYGMDRSLNWKLTDLAMKCLVQAAGNRAESAGRAVTDAYDRLLTPDGAGMTDEYIPPTCIGGYDGMHDGDAVFHTNYRQDRAIQLTRAFTGDGYPGEAIVRPGLNLSFAGMTRYYDGFTRYLIAPMDSEGNMGNLLGEVIARAGLRQLRIAETQKFRHVTSFFNGKSTSPFPGEDQVMIPSDLDASSYASHPEMEAWKVTEELLRRLEDNPYRFILVNYANGDMVGHTGDFHAAVLAVETVDACLGTLVERLLAVGARILVTADHGNAEQMIDESTGEVQTSHSMNPVDLTYIAADAGSRGLRPHGILADIAPTVLELLGLEIPPEMTARSLFVR